MANPPTWGNVKFLCNFEGANNSQAAADLSDSMHSSFTYGNSAVNSTTQKKFGQSSLSTSGATNRYFAVADGLTDFNFGSGEFTIELWAYPQTNSDCCFASMWHSTTVSNEGFFFGRSAANLAFYYSTTGTNTPVVQAAHNLTTSAWSHYAVDRDASGVIRVYHNGTVIASATDTSALFASTRTFRLGNDELAASNFPGFIDGVRIVKGEAVYGGAFTPSENFYPLTIGKSVSWNNQRVYGSQQDGSVRGGLWMPNHYVGGPVGAITGTVKEEGANVARTVRAYRRVTGELLGEALSDGGTGVFTIDVNGVVDECYVIALDDTGSAPDYNAQIFDLVVPA